jgi:hypothetical protein
MVYDWDRFFKAVELAGGLLKVYCPPGQTQKNFSTLVRRAGQRRGWEIRCTWEAIDEGQSFLWVGIRSRGKFFGVTLGTLMRPPVEFRWYSFTPETQTKRRSLI